MVIIATIIIAATLAVTYWRKIETDFICTHLLWVACTCSAIYIQSGNTLAITYSIVFLWISSVYLTFKELWIICRSVTHAS